MTATEILASLTVSKSGNHTHYVAGGYFLCPTHQNYRLVPVQGGVTCTKCLKRHAQLTEQAKNER